MKTMDTIQKRIRRSKAQKSKDVALVLSSGGPRGFAYIGAIEELQERGYNITSVAGTSMGSLIGGIFASGHLPEAKEWFLSLDAWKVFKLMDLTMSKNSVVKGEKVIKAIEEIVPDVLIEDLPIPFRAVATDLCLGEEVVFDSGSLFKAIRASISIPGLFQPVEYDGRTLIDGGIVNSIPLNRVVRHAGDILIGFNVNDIEKEGVQESLGTNLYSLLDRTFDLMNHRNTILSLEMTPPDVLVNMPFSAYGSIPDYAKVREISDRGRALMREALDEWERR